MLKKKDKGSDVYPCMCSCGMKITDDGGSEII